jgi:glucose dehydrogenase
MLMLQNPNIFAMGAKSQYKVCWILAYATGHVLNTRQNFTIANTPKQNSTSSGEAPWVFSVVGGQRKDGTSITFPGSDTSVKDELLLMFAVKDTYYPTYKTVPLTVWKTSLPSA